MQTMNTSQTVNSETKATALSINEAKTENNAAAVDPDSVARSNLEMLSGRRQNRTKIITQDKGTNKPLDRVFDFNTTTINNHETSATKSRSRNSSDEADSDMSGK